MSSLDRAANTSSKAESKFVASLQNTAASAVPMLDIQREYQDLASEISAAISQVLNSGAYVLGPACTRLEENIAKLCDANYGIGCASGSDALLLALMAGNVGPGDEVIVPSFTFFATASAVTRLGATPVFAEINPASFNMLPDHVASCVTSRTKAIIPVHLFGQPAQMDAICELAKRHNLYVVEDCAQAIGATYQGIPVGSIGDVGAFSFYPTKNMGGCGDGGMMTCNSEALSGRLRRLRAHGMEPRYHHQEIGINSRLDSIQAAILGVKLPRLQAWNRARRGNAARYSQMFQAVNLDNHIVLPTELPQRQHTWNQYTIRVPHGQRDNLRKHLSEANIGCEVYYPVPLHRQPCFESLGYGEGTLPETEMAAGEVLSLPIFPQLTEREQQTVVARIALFFGITQSGSTNHAIKGPNFLKKSAAQTLANPPSPF